MSIKKVTLKDSFKAFSEHWSPRIVGELNGQHIKLVKAKGEFVMHKHDDEDELFNLDEWHDSYVWDQVRLKYLKGKPQHKLCPDGYVGHVWSRHSVIKDYIGHMKGKILKDEKRWNV